MFRWEWVFNIVDGCDHIVTDETRGALAEAQRIDAIGLRSGTGLAPALIFADTFAE